MPLQNSHGGQEAATAVGWWKSPIQIQEAGDKGQTVMADLFGSDSDEPGEEGGEKDPTAEEGDGEEKRPKGEPLAMVLPHLPQFKEGTKLVSPKSCCNTTSPILPSRWSLPHTHRHGAAARGR